MLNFKSHAPFEKETWMCWLDGWMDGEVSSFFPMAVLQGWGPLFCYNLGLDVKLLGSLKGIWLAGVQKVMRFIWVNEWWFKTRKEEDGLYVCHCFCLLKSDSSSSIIVCLPSRPYKLWAPLVQNGSVLFGNRSAVFWYTLIIVRNFV